MKNVSITTERMTLRSLEPGDVTDSYLGWLNDEDLQHYTRRHGKTMSIDELQQFVVDSADSQDLHLAMIVNDGNWHIGNIFLNSIDREKKEADLSIMIGDKDAHGKGFAKEAINAIVDYAFTELDLNRVYACSPNPDFNHMIEKVGWRHIETKKEYFEIDGVMHDLDCWEVRS